LRSLDSFPTRRSSDLLVASLGGGTLVCDGGAAMGSETFQAIYNEMLKYEGWPYEWAGQHPSVGFDCSGLMVWSYGLQGIQLPRTDRKSTRLNSSHVKI